MDVETNSYDLFILKRHSSSLNNNVLACCLSRLVIIFVSSSPHKNTQNHKQKWMEERKRNESRFFHTLSYNVVSYKFSFVFFRGRFISNKYTFIFVYIYLFVYLFLESNLFLFSGLLPFCVVCSSCYMRYPFLVVFVSHFFMNVITK